MIKVKNKYRLRKSFFGKCILQKIQNSPSFIGGFVDSSVRIIEWRDVDYDKSPLLFISEENEK